MALVRSGSHSHRVARLGPDEYRISWVVDHKHGRILYPRRHGREVDRAGALRFVLKWDVQPHSAAGLGNEDESSVRNV